MRRLRIQLDHTKNQTIIIYTTNPSCPVIFKGEGAYTMAVVVQTTTVMQKPTTMGTIGVTTIMTLATMDGMKGRPDPRTVIRTNLTIVDIPTGMGRAVNPIRKMHIETLFRGDRTTGNRSYPITAAKTRKGK